MDEGGPCCFYVVAEREGCACYLLVRSVRAMLDASQYSLQMLPNRLGMQLLGRLP